MRTKRLIVASGVAGLLLILASSLGAHASLWCPTPVPGVPIRTSLCEYITGRAEVSSPTPLSPLTLFGLWRDLRATALTDWADRVQVRGGKRANFFPPVGCGRVMERGTVQPPEP